MSAESDAKQAEVDAKAAQMLAFKDGAYAQYFVWEEELMDLLEELRVLLEAE